MANLHSQNFKAALTAISSLIFTACASTTLETRPVRELRYPTETRFMSLRQMTLGGINTRAHWSFDGNWIVYQHQDFDAMKGLNSAHDPEGVGKNPGCGQIFKMRKNGRDLQRVSNGNGFSSSPNFLPGDSRILFSTTGIINPNCPAEPRPISQYVIPVFSTYQIYAALSDGTDPIPLEPSAPHAYNSEATVCKDRTGVFTSDRNGHFNLYHFRLDRFDSFQNIKPITHSDGYNGGAVFSHDCKKLACQVAHPKPGSEMDAFENQLEEQVLAPNPMEIWLADADGTHPTQLTHLNAISFSPTFTPDGKKIIFSSNYRNPLSHDFNLYMIRLDGSAAHQISGTETSHGFDGFPSFSPDGGSLIFSSKRNAKTPHETNLFVAEWVDLEP